MRPGGREGGREGERGKCVRRAADTSLDHTSRPRRVLGRRIRPHLFSPRRRHRPRLLRGFRWGSAPSAKTVSALAGSSSVLQLGTSSTFPSTFAAPLPCTPRHGLRRSGPDTFDVPGAGDDPRLKSREAGVAHCGAEEPPPPLEARLRLLPQRGAETLTTRCAPGASAGAVRTRR